MARTKNQKNRYMEEALAKLIQDQEALLAHASETDRQLAELLPVIVERLTDIETILLRISRMMEMKDPFLEALPDPIRAKRYAANSFPS